MGNILKSMSLNNLKDDNSDTSFGSTVDDRFLPADNNETINIIETVESPLEDSSIEDELKLPLDNENKKSNINYMQEDCKCNKCNCESCDCKCQCCSCKCDKCSCENCDCSCDCC